MSSREQSLAIPAVIRAEVRERDGDVCRLCGRTDVIAHHIRYGGDEIGMGGRRFHSVENIVSLGQHYDHQCHEKVHANKRLWTPLLIRVIDMPGVTAFALYRWVSSGVPVDLGLAPQDVASILRDQAERSLRARRPATTTRAGTPGTRAVPR